MAVHLAVAGGVLYCVFLCCPFSAGVLGGIWDLIGSVSEGFPTYFLLYTVELQWLEHRWLVYHGFFELVLESLGKNPIAADIIIFGII